MPTCIECGNLKKLLGETFAVAKAAFKQRETAFKQTAELINLTIANEEKEKKLQKKLESSLERSKMQKIRLNKKGQKIKQH